MLDLFTELQATLFGFLDRCSLAHLQTACRSLHQRCGDDTLWRALVLHQWGWLVRAAPPSRTWKWLCMRLATRGTLCVVGVAKASDKASIGRAYAPNTGKWADLPACSEQRNMPAVVRDVAGGLVAAGGLVHGAGGEAHGARLALLRSVERLAPEACEWHPLPPLAVARCCCAGALDLRGRIFVAGGGENMYRSSRAWNSVEWLEDPGLAGVGDPSDWVWRPGPPMSQPRCALGVAVSYATDRLFAAGGYAGDGVYLDTAESLDLSAGSNGRWQALPRMSCRRAGTNAAVGPDHRIYVLGGGPDGQKEHDSMEALDPREGRWHTSLARLKVGHFYNAAAFGPDGRLYVAGSFSHAGQLDVVERYDPRADAWEFLPRIGVPIMFCAGTFLF